MNYDPTWVLYIRSDNLTYFFKIFPFFASGLFYISAIAIGYWLRPGNRLFTHLGFLIPFNSILNVILKNLIAVMRPSSELHLVKIWDPYGFPSGDAQVSTIFWGMIFLSTKSRIIRYLSVLVITLIAFSRVYLGVSALADVIGGVCTALIIIAIWRNEFVQNIIDKWFSGNSASFSLIVGGIIVTIYLLPIPYSKLFMAPVIGALLGYGLSLRFIGYYYANQEYQDGYQLSCSRIITIILSYIMLLILLIAIPAIKVNYTTSAVSEILEATLMVFMIFSIFPKIQDFCIEKYDNRKK